MSEHTPGPWIAEYISHTGWVVRWDNPESRICSLRWIGGPHPPEVDKIVEADARLIAAAPDLLAACKEAEQKFRVETEIYKMLVAAIAKAEGE